MKAALVTALGAPPTFGEYPDPEEREGFVKVRMRAAGVHTIVRSLASGAHYGAGDDLPFIAGVDGIATTADGSRVYTGGAPEPLGTISEWTLVPQLFVIPVPDGLSDVQAAAVVNPAISSWMPLVGKAALQPGQTVLILGATGTSGRLAVKIAFHLGAGRVIAAGRNAAVLAELAADERVTTIDLGQDAAGITAAIVAAQGDGIHIVLDYLWGSIAEAAMSALRRTGLEHHAISAIYVQIGALAGRSITLDAALLRSSNVTVTGSGAGSIDPALMLKSIPPILELAAAGELFVAVDEATLADVEKAWGAASDRLVITIP